MRAAKRKSIELIIVIALIALGVCYGLEVASNGIEQVQGPVGAAMAQNAAVQVPTPTPTPTPEPTPAPTAVQPQAQVLQQEQGAAPQDLATTSYIANKTGDMLQVVSHHGIEWVVSLFDKLLK